MQQPVLDVPQLLRQIDVIGMRVVKTLDLVPECVDLLGAVFLNVVQLRQLVDQLAVFEDRHEQLLRRKVIDPLALPRRLRVENFQIAAVVDRLVVDAQIVRDGLAGVVAEETVDLFEVRVRDLAHVLADLDLGDDSPVLVLDGRQLVHAAEHGLGFGRDEPFADAEQVDLRALVEDVLDNILVERVRARDFAALPACLVEQLPRLFRQIRHVAGVEPDAAFCKSTGL